MRTIAILTALTLAGCASSFDEQILLSKSKCCSSYEQLSYQQVSGNDEMEFTIDKRSPAFNFTQGAAHFYAVELSGTNRQFLLRSFLNGAEIRRAASPVLLELDKNFDVIAQAEPKLQYSETPAYEEPHMRGLVELNDNTKYLIVYPSSDESTAQIAAFRKSDSSSMMGVEYVYFPGRMVKRELTKTPTGNLELVPLQSAEF